jgi:hypothetical protein
MPLTHSAGLIARTTGWYSEEKGKKYAGYFVEGVPAVCDPVGYSINNSCTIWNRICNQ